MKIQSVVTVGVFLCLWPWTSADIRAQDLLMAASDLDAVIVTLPKKTCVDNLTKLEQRLADLDASGIQTPERTALWHAITIMRILRQTRVALSSSYHKAGPMLAALGDNQERKGVVKPSTGGRANPLTWSLTPTPSR